jgi:OFA family oxalate/formate antiporter-like MFS transporter
LVAGLGGPHSFAYVVLGVGLVAGIGVGVAYIVPIAVGNHWFPEAPGLVTGIGVAGFAVGAALVGIAAEALILSWGATPFDALRLLGTAFLAIGMPAALLMAYPDGAETASAIPPRRRELLRSVEFRQLFPAMACGLAAGFAVNSNLKDLAPPGGVAAGVTAVSAFAIANAFGRVAWGWIFDRMLPSSVLRLNLIAQAGVLAGVFFLVRDLPTLLVFAAFAGFNYGGVLVLYASTVARRWGVQHIGLVYGLLFIANIVAAPAPMLAGFSLDVTGSFAPAFVVFAVLAAAMAVRVGGPVNRTAAGAPPSRGKRV